ncbi:hypothetical protein BS47DRAFT_1482400 [Hydnum rufescens UP504]|uniref:Uncharacterized protein n=1 Tax=Hydnum rufescens UP504 TaxID=1448309 RepID=A0A9P6DYX7_9AGAM|nr:hypothetical protein BS47DRAFT_1482400 [Hydnum rufescens UP504]
MGIQASTELSVASIVPNTFHITLEDSLTEAPGQLCMSGLPPRPTPPGVPSSINTPHRGHRPSSPSVPHRRLPSPRLNRRAENLTRTSALPIGIEQENENGTATIVTFLPRVGGLLNQTENWIWSDGDENVALNILVMTMSEIDPRLGTVSQRITVGGVNVQTLQVIENGDRMGVTTGRRLLHDDVHQTAMYLYLDLRSPRPRDWAHSPRRRVSPPRKSRSRSPHREDHPESRGEPSARHSSRRQRSLTPAQPTEPLPLSPGELEDHIKTNNNNQAKKRELSSPPIASPPPGDSRPQVKEVLPRLAPSVQHQSPHSQAPAAKNQESHPSLTKSSMSPSTSKGDEIAEEHKQGSDYNSVSDAHGTEDGQKIAEVIAVGKKAADDRARLSAEIKRAKQELVLATLDLIFAEDRRKIAERQRINMEKGLPLDAFDGLVRDGVIDDMGILAASTQSVAVDVVTE